MTDKVEGTLDGNGGLVPRAELDAANANYRALYDALLERDETIGQMDRRIKELEDGAARANELIHLYKNQRDEYEREAAECADVCLALEAKLKRYETVDEGASRAESAEVSRWLAEWVREGVAKSEGEAMRRQADEALVGALRELRPKSGHLYAEARIRTGVETPFCCRIAWRTPGRDGVRNTRFYGSLADAIREYKERED